MGAALSNAIGVLFPPPPQYTDADLPDLSDKVYLITGASGGIGMELARLLYSRNSRVWIAARSREKAAAAMEKIKHACPESTGELHFLHVDLADLATVKPAVDEFLSREKKLHVLWNNAGVMSPLLASTPYTAQGLDLQLGVNCVAAFLLTRLLTPVLAQTAKLEHPGAVRVVWVGSLATEMSPYSTGISMDNVNYAKSSLLPGLRYLVSKSGAYLYGTEYARRHREDGIVSVSMNPGNLDSELWRDLPGFLLWIMRHTFLYPSINGALTELFAGVSPEVTLEKSGCWIQPWGRIWPIKKSLQQAALTEAEGGSGVAAQFWEWSETQAEPYC